MAPYKTNKPPPDSAKGSVRKTLSVSESMRVTWERTSKARPRLSANIRMMMLFRMVPKKVLIPNTKAHSSLVSDEAIWKLWRQKETQAPPPPKRVRKQTNTSSYHWTLKRCWDICVYVTRPVSAECLRCGTKLSGHDRDWLSPSVWKKKSKNQIKWQDSARLTAKVTEMVLKVAIFSKKVSKCIALRLLPCFTSSFCGLSCPSLLSLAAGWIFDGQDPILVADSEMHSQGPD